MIWYMIAFMLVLGFPDERIGKLCGAELQGIKESDGERRIPQSLLRARIQLPKVLPLGPT
jgi:hypothetical protein